MPSEYSYVHRQPNYWKVRYDEWNGWEDPHIHAKQGDRELQVYTKTLGIKIQDGRFSNDEIEEIKNIAKEYRNRYCESFEVSPIFNIESDEKLFELYDLYFGIADKAKSL